jgi:O-acetyl-ADP-ribose deacetylase (regulator of RNase III)
MTIARQHGLKTIAFPAISTGVYRFPLARATAIAIRTVADELRTMPDARVTFMCFGDDALAAYDSELAGLA